jgi:hypothetical protein
VNILLATIIGTVIPTGAFSISTRLPSTIQKYYVNLILWNCYLTLLTCRRSPWSNEYDPPLDDGTVPSTKLRKLEVAANDAFDTYREM